MPKLWSETVETHRRAVREATMDTAAALVAEHGLAAVTMSRVAAATGIGRATLYKYFPDVESILLAWHERQIGDHLAQLRTARDRADGARARLDAVLRGYAMLAHRRPRGTELAGLLHRGEHLNRARRQLGQLVAELLADAATAGAVRDDLTPDELATYCLHALSAAAKLPTEAAVGRLVAVTLDGLAPRPGP